MQCLASVRHDDIACNSVRPWRKNPSARELERRRPAVAVGGVCRLREGRVCSEGVANPLETPRQGRRLHGSEIGNRLATGRTISTIRAMRNAGTTGTAQNQNNRQGLTDE